jgi:hypothetical protein
MHRKKKTWSSLLNNIFLHYFHTNRFSSSSIHLSCIPNEAWSELGTANTNNSMIDGCFLRVCTGTSQLHKVKTADYGNQNDSGIIHVTLSARRIYLSVLIIYSTLNHGPIGRADTTCRAKWAPLYACLIWLTSKWKGSTLPNWSHKFAWHHHTKQLQNNVLLKPAPLSFRGSVVCFPDSREELLKTWRIEYVGCKLPPFHWGNE